MQPIFEEPKKLVTAALTLSSGTTAYRSEGGTQPAPADPAEKNAEGEGSKQDATR